MPAIPVDGKVLPDGQVLPDGKVSLIEIPAWAVGQTIRTRRTRNRGDLAAYRVRSPVPAVSPLIVILTWWAGDRWEGGTRAVLDRCRGLP